jgi:hypothetical protein
MFVAIKEVGVPSAGDTSVGDIASTMLPAPVCGATDAVTAPTDPLFVIIVPSPENEVMLFVPVAPVAPVAPVLPVAPAGPVVPIAPACASNSQFVVSLAGALAPLLSCSAIYEEA